jgi:hypothetical protein
LVISDLVKQRFNRGQPAELYFWRNNTGQEVDVLWEEGNCWRAVEIKSGATLVSAWLGGLHRWHHFVCATLRPHAPATLDLGPVGWSKPSGSTQRVFGASSLIAASPSGQPRRGTQAPPGGTTSFVPPYDRMRRLRWIWGP